MIKMMMMKAILTVLRAPAPRCTSPPGALPASAPSRASPSAHTARRPLPSSDFASLSLTKCARPNGAPGDAAGKGKGKGKGKKQPPPKPQIGSRVLSGLTLSEAKHSAGILLEPLPPPPVREPPEHGCPMLEVHRGFKQSGLYHKASVLIDEDGVTVYNAHLNQVDVATGVNRYYIVQALVVCAKFEVFCHWGAIGREEEEEWGATHLRENFKRYLHASKTDAISDFKKWYLKKTNWEFDARHAFRQTPGWYNSIELSARAPHVVGVLLSPSKRARGGGGVAPCSLEPAVSELVALLFDEDASLSTMEGSGLRCDTDFNVSALTPERIDKARAILERLSQLLRLPPAAPPVVVDLAADPPDEKPEPAGRGRRKRTKPGPAAPSVVESAAAAQARVEQEQQIWRAKLDALSNAFQQTIPARDPARIDSDEKLQERERMLDVLADVVLTQHLVADATAEATSAAAQLAAASGDVPLEPHPLDLQYAALSCKVRAVAPDDPVYLAVEAALRNTSEPLVRDGMCGFSHRTRDVIELAGLYELEREGEAERHAPFTSLGNRRLLWHGTGVGCAAAIVAQGLRISKHHAGRVGRGLYLADQSNKSGHYTLPSKGGEATMFLCEAALGRASVVHHDRAELTRAPHGFDSVVTESLTQPDPACDVELILGGRAARFATGPLQDKPPPQAAAAATSAPDAAGASAAGAGKKTARVHTAFSQTEYLVYDELQVRLRYLVKLRI
ncbi:hypothetical protein T492DRAFT_1151168 [Pavlovales sp. CCMP2436]|nr:hypothetical protein T492DRAFT_1151168 [Pavlovales sp. CCMP2436]